MTITRTNKYYPNFPTHNQHWLKLSFVVLIIKNYMQTRIYFQTKKLMDLTNVKSTIKQPINGWSSPI
jgi:hypothetical protein